MSLKLLQCHTHGVGRSNANHATPETQCHADFSRVPAGDSPIQVFFTAGHTAMLGGVGGTGGGPRGGHGAQPQKNPFSAPVRGLPGSKGLRSSRVSGRPGGMALIRKYGIMMKRQVPGESPWESPWESLWKLGEFQGYGYVWLAPSVPLLLGFLVNSTTDRFVKLRDCEPSWGG